MSGAPAPPRLARPNLAGMDLGEYGIWCGGWGDDGLEEAVGEIEALGYGAVWMSGGFSPGLSPRFGRLLEATASIPVASGIVGVWLTEPQVLAEAVAELEERFPGRFLLGLGVSHAPLVESFGLSYERPFERMTSYLDGLDAAQPPTPASRRVLAALGPKMLRLAAERSLGAHPYFVPVEHTRLARETLGGDALLAPEVAVVVNADRSAALATARAYAALYLTLPNYVNNLRRLGYSEEDVQGSGSDRLIDAVIPSGTPTAVAARIREHREAGADHVCVQVIPDEANKFPLAAYGELRAAL
jgi:probable F420-dependent oxidoreductase